MSKAALVDSAWCCRGMDFGDPQVAFRFQLLVGYPVVMWLLTSFFRIIYLQTFNEGTEKKKRPWSLKSEVKKFVECPVPIWISYLLRLLPWNYDWCSKCQMRASSKGGVISLSFQKPEHQHMLLQFLDPKIPYSLPSPTQKVAALGRSLDHQHHSTHHLGTSWPPGVLCWHPKTLEASVGRSPTVSLGATCPQFQGTASFRVVEPWHIGGWYMQRYTPWSGSAGWVVLNRHPAKKEMLFCW